MLGYLSSEAPVHHYVPSEIPENALTEAARAGAAADVRKLLSLPEHRGLGRFALYVGAESGELEVVKVCVEAEVDVNVRCGQYGDSPLQRAAEGGHLAVLTLLRDSGAAIDCQNSDGCTPLHDAAGSGQSEVVRYLIDAGADLSLTDYSGATILAVVVKGCPELFSFVVQRCSTAHIYAATLAEPQWMCLALQSLELVLVRDRPMSRRLLSPRHVLFYPSDLEPDDLAYTEDEYFDEEVWSRYSGDAIPSSVQGSVYVVRECALPLAHAIDVNLLKALVHVSLTVDDAALFDTPAIGLIVLSNWLAYGRTHHLAQMALFLVLLACATVTNYTFHIWALADSPQYQVVWFLLAVQFVINSVFVVIEGVHARNAFQDGKFISFFLDLQNFIDWTTYATLYAGLILRFAEQEETAQTAAIIATNTILLWLKMLYFLRPFKSTGPLVRMVFFIFNEILPLLSILIAVIFGFSQSFYLLSYSNEEMDFADPMLAIFNAFLYMLGSIDNKMMTQSPNNPELAQLLLCVFIFISSILLLNLLIAVMSNAYAKIESKQNAEWERERALIMTEQIHLFPPSNTKYLYCLQRKEDVLKREANEADSLTLRLEKLEQAQTRLRETLVDVRALVLGLKA